MAEPSTRAKADFERRLAIYRKEKAQHEQLDRALPPPAAGAEGRTMAYRSYCSSGWRTSSQRGAPTEELGRRALAAATFGCASRWTEAPSQNLPTPPSVCPHALARPPCTVPETETTDQADGRDREADAATADSFRSSSAGSPCSSILVRRILAPRVTPHAAARAAQHGPLHADAGGGHPLGPQPRPHSHRRTARHRASALLRGTLSLRLYNGDVIAV